MSLPFCKLVGYELSYIASGEKKATSDLVRDSAIQGLLFVPDNAHTNEGTMKELRDIKDALVQLHEGLKNKEDVVFEIVVIPAHQTQECPEAFLPPGTKEVFSQKGCPFLAISSEKALRIQEHIIRKYKIKEVPSFILIDTRTTKVILHNGLEKLLQDPMGEQFPWEYPTFSKVVGSGALVKNRQPLQLLDQCTKNGGDERKLPGTDVLTMDHATNVIKGVFFAAYWCPPCRSFLTSLVHLYQSINKQCKKLEIVFVSSDRSQESFDRFFATMPWLAIPFEDEQRRDLLTKAFNVKAIPHLTLLDPDDNVITHDGRLDVNDDLEGIDFPWVPRLVDELKDRHSSTVNNTLCVIYFTDDSDTDYDLAENTLNSIATEIEKSPTEDAFTPQFFIAVDSDLAESLRVFMDLEETKSYLVIMDVPNFRYSVEPVISTSTISVSCVKEFMNKFESNKVIYKHIPSRFV